MAKYKIIGQTKLQGEIGVSGAKNSALKVFPACLLLDGVSTISNVPQIEDIHRMVEIMRDLGVGIEQQGSSYTINPTITKTQLHPQLHQKLRASILLIGPMLLEKGTIDFPQPGGCVLGKRPIDFFLEGFKAFGVRVDNRDDGYSLTVEKLHSAKIVFPRVSHTATEALMTFATKISGTTVLINAAMEPEVLALADFLNSCGAKISGAGTSVITIEGVDKLHSGSFVTIPDRIEAGTFAILGAASGSEIKVTGIVPEHNEVLWELFRKANINFELGPDYIQMLPSPNMQALPKDIVTHEYPGLATDLQPALTVLMTQAQGNSLVHETIFEGRLFYVDALNSMGANILMCDPHRVLVSGPTELSGRKVASPDIRAGIALVIAGLIAHGQTEIDNVYLIKRGYENIVSRLQGLGAQIEEVE
jgi:UDP-N-acetylglucosamine 1-carboxyvinyltransferase